MVKPLAPTLRRVMVVVHCLPEAELDLTNRLTDACCRSGVVNFDIASDDEKDMDLVEELLEDESCTS